MARDPSEAEVSGFLEFAGLSPSDRPLATRALKIGNYNTNALMMEFYDDQEAFRKKYSWDESAFSSGRDGTTSENPSFHIESAPDYSNVDILHGVSPGRQSPYHSHHAQMAPSRPPTRTKNRSPLSRVIDLTNPNVTADDEDEDLKRALRESAEAAGLDAPPQVSGVLSEYQNTPAFGPATREEYDVNQWALVPSDPAPSNASPIILPSTRKRDPNVPALLINDNTTLEHRLGALLTIIHEIPLARNTLLQLGDQSSSYGYSSKWWTGKPIMPPDVIAAMAEAGTQGYGWDEYPVPLEPEIHRLLAFLDSTERSFGSTHVLAKCLSASWDMEDEFFTTLVQRVGIDAIAPFVHIARTFRIGPPGTEHDAENCSHTPLCYFTLGITEDNRTQVKTLYDLWDYELWKPALEDNLHGNLDEHNMSLFDQLGDVMTMRLNNPFKADLEVPQYWNPERYMWSRKKAAIGILWLRRRLRAKAKKLEDQLAPPGQPSLEDRLRMLVTEVSRCDVLIKYLEANPKFRAFEQSISDKKQFPNGASDAPCSLTEEESEKLEAIKKTRENSIRRSDKIKAHIEDLKSQLERCDDSQRFVGELLTDPDKERPDPFTCKSYSLRGVAAGKDVVYLCRRSEPNLINLSEEAEPLDQWWRLEYSSNSQQPVKAERTDLEYLQKHIWNESAVLTLIYATEDALNTPRIPLSDALQHFIKCDNRYFQKEVEQEEAMGTAGATTFQNETVASFQGRDRAGSLDSMASNRASLGSLDSRAGDFDDLLELGGAMEGATADQMQVDTEAAHGASADWGDAGRDSPVLGWTASVEPPAAGADMEHGQSVGSGDVEMEEADAPAQEMKEVSTKPIFLIDPERSPRPTRE